MQPFWLASSTIAYYPILCLALTTITYYLHLQPLCITRMCHHYVLLACSPSRMLFARMYLHYVLPASTTIMSCPHLPPVHISRIYHHYVLPTSTTITYYPHLPPLRITRIYHPYVLPATTTIAFLSERSLGLESSCLRFPFLSCSLPLLHSHTFRTILPY